MDDKATQPATVIQPPHLRMGGVLSVGGPDGVGKTTLCEALVGEVLAGAEVLHVRFPRLLPRRSATSRLEIRLGPGKTPDLNAARVYPPVYPAPVAVAKTLYLFVDFWLGWMLRVRPLVRRGGWVVFERGWWDHAVDPRRYRLRPPARLVPLLGRLLPKPDLFLLLEADPEVVIARKPQLSAGELVRQMEAWHTVLPPSSRRVSLDATRPADEVLRAAASEIERLVGDRLGARAQPGR
jgi:thymidylate kinase